MDTFWRLDAGLALLDYIASLQHELFDIGARAAARGDDGLYALWEETLSWVDEEGVDLLSKARDQIKAADSDLRMLLSETIDDHIRLLEERRKTSSDERYLKLIPDLVRQFDESLSRLKIEKEARSDGAT